MTSRRLALGLFCCLALALPAAADTGGAVRLDSTIYVERGSPANGRMLEPASRFSHGDRLVYVLRWSRPGGVPARSGFTLTNPLPRSVYYQGSAEGDEQVSVDGGHTWGRIGELRLGARLATPEDVTHVRWRVAPKAAAAGTGQIAYSAIVR